MVYEPAQLRLDGIRIVDVDSCVTTVPTSVLINGGRIEYIGELTTHDPEALNLEGYWAMPALVDMHVHLTFECRAHHDCVRFEHGEPSAVTAMRVAQELSEALHAGVCLVRDVGAKGQALDKALQHVAEGRILGPHVITCGEPLCLPGGHG